MSVQIKWFVESVNIDTGATDMIEELGRQNEFVVPISYAPFRGRSYSSYSGDDKIIALTSINLAQQLWDEKPTWRKGIWANFPAYDCSKYLPQIGDLCLNGDYIMMPFSDLWRNRHSYLHLTEDSCIFIRPNAGVKEYTGAVVDFLNLKSQLEAWREYVVPDSLAVISRPRKIKAEWRVIVSNYKGTKEIVSSSLSRLDGNQTHVLGSPTPVINLAREALNLLIPPDPMFAIDVALCGDNSYKIVEINAFSTCGLYATDKVAIIRAAKTIAEDIWSN